MDEKKVHATKPSLNRDGGRGVRFNVSPIWHNIEDERIGKGACTELLGSSSLASTLKRGYKSVNKARVPAKSLHLEAKHFSCK